MFTLRAAEGWSPNHSRLNVRGIAARATHAAVPFLLSRSSGMRELFCRFAPSHNGFLRGAAPGSELFAKILTGGYPKPLCQAVNLDFIGLPTNIDCAFWHVISQNAERKFGDAILAKNA